MMGFAVALFVLAFSFLSSLALLSEPSKLREEAVDEGESGGGLSILLLSLVWTCFIVPTLALWIALFLPEGRVGRGLLLAVAAVSAIGLWIPFVRRGPRSAFEHLRSSWRALRQDLWRERGVIVFAGVAATAWLGWFDPTVSIESSCAYTSAYVATGHECASAPTLLVENLNDERLGATAVLAGALTLFGAGGFHLLYGVLAFMYTLGGMLVGRVFGGSRAGGWLVSLFFVLNPGLLAIRVPDENLLSLALLLAFFVELCRAKRHFVLLGLLLAVAVSIRHVLFLVVLVFFPWSAWRYGVKASLRALVAFTLMTLPIHLRHLYAFGSVFSLESHSQFQAFSYSILGLSFSWNGMLNWPVFDEIVRTPHNPFPMLVGWLLEAARRWGSVLLAIVVVGVFAPRRPPTPLSGRVAFSLFAPLMLFLLLQEAWDQDNKLGVLAIVYPYFGFCLVAGAGALRRRPRLVGLSVVVLVSIAFVGQHALSNWRVPRDPRYIQAHGVLVGPRIDSLLEWRRARWLDFGLLPDSTPLLRADLWSWMSRVGMGIRAFAGTPPITRVPHGWGEATGVEAGPPLTLALDLDTAPVARPIFRLESGAIDLDLRTTEGPVVVHDFPVSWGSRSVDVVAARSGGHTVIALVMKDPTLVRDGPGRTQMEAHSSLCSLLAWLAGQPRHRYCSDVHHFEPRSRDGLLRVLLPAGLVSVAWVVNRAGERYRLWRARVRPGSIERVGVFEPFWHN
jgi:hypothetical protein